jgi:hypothetical protein
MKIDTDIPLPVVPGYKRPRSEVGRLVADLQPGHSILCENDGQLGTARKAMWVRGWKCTYIREGSGWRVWRRS